MDFFSLQIRYLRNFILGYANTNSSSCLFSAYMNGRNMIIHCFNMIMKHVTTTFYRVFPNFLIHVTYNNIVLLKKKIYNYYVHNKIQNGIVKDINLYHITDDFDHVNLGEGTRANVILLLGEDGQICKHKNADENGYKKE